MPPADILFMQENPANLSNVIGVVFMGKFEFESMRKHILKQTECLNRARHKQVKYLGNWYYQRMSEAEFATKE